MPKVIVLGAGPAGAAVAIGLKRLGYKVQVVSEWRRFKAVEGVSARVLEGLKQAGLKQALACAAQPSARQVSWSGVAQAINQESLLDRDLFDQALRQDLSAAGVTLIAARVVSVSSSEQGHLVSLETGQTLNADFLVEARGRAAPLAAGRIRGPETVSLLNQWQEAPGKPGSALESLPDGWAWMARLADGRAYWQITQAAQHLPPKAKLSAYCARRRSESLWVKQLFSEQALAPAALYARSSTAILLQQSCGANWIRVGDAAMAVDPLSGNGIFQSLSSALQAPAVINTLLQRPAHAALAQQFHQARVEHLFMRFARTGRDFYALETQWPEQAFWQARGRWPDQQPIHAKPDIHSLKVITAPVIEGDFIVPAEVVSTADQPLGVWHLQGVALAPIVRAMQQGQLTQALNSLAAPERKWVQSWLLAQGYRPTPAELRA